jgi:hypothetical protein
VAEPEPTEAAVSPEPTEAAAPPEATEAAAPPEAAEIAVPSSSAGDSPGVAEIDPPETESAQIESSPSSEDASGSTPTAGAATPIVAPSPVPVVEPEQMAAAPSPDSSLEEQRPVEGTTEAPVAEPQTEAADAGEAEGAGPSVTETAAVPAPAPAPVIEAQPEPAIPPSLQTDFSADSEPQPNDGPQEVAALRESVVTAIEDEPFTLCGEAGYELTIRSSATDGASVSLRRTGDFSIDGTIRLTEGEPSQLSDTCEVTLLRIVSIHSPIAHLRQRMAASPGG